MKLDRTQRLATAIDQAVRFFAVVAPASPAFNHQTAT